MTFSKSHIKRLGPKLEPSKLTANLVFLQEEDRPQILSKVLTSSVNCGPEGQLGLGPGILGGTVRETCFERHLSLKN